MARHYSVMKILAHHGRGVKGVRPETTATLEACSAVEARFGTNKALDGLLAAYMSTMSTMAAKESMLFDTAAATLEDAAKQLRETKAALQSGGRFPAGAVTKEVTVIGEPEGRA